GTDSNHGRGSVRWLVRFRGKSFPLFAAECGRPREFHESVKRGSDTLTLEPDNGAMFTDIVDLRERVLAIRRSEKRPTSTASDDKRTSASAAHRTDARSVVRRPVVSRACAETYERERSHAARA